MSKLFRVIKEAALVILITAVLGIVANAYHPEGIDLRRDFFRGLRTPSPQTSDSGEVGAGGGVIDPVGPDDAPKKRPEKAPEQTPAVGSSGGDAPLPPDGVVPSPLAGAAGVLAQFEGPSRVTVQRLLDKNIQVITHDEVVKLYQDELFEYGAYTFVDARTPSKYAEGHIPTAIVFDHFHFDRYIDDVFAQCQSAIAVIVYCHGGECTDSELAAQLLLDRGIERSKLKVYVGGVEAWTDAGLPLKQGSGQGDER